jgi:hypothetical protein
VPGPGCQGGDRGWQHGCQISANCCTQQSTLLTVCIRHFAEEPWKTSSCLDVYPKAAQLPLAHQQCARRHCYTQCIPCRQHSDQPVSVTFSTVSILVSYLGHSIQQSVCIAGVFLGLAALVLILATQYGILHVSTALGFSYCFVSSSKAKALVHAVRFLTTEACTQSFGCVAAPPSVLPWFLVSLRMRGTLHTQ